jgi:hypothetical protein
MAVPEDQEAGVNPVNYVHIYAPSGDYIGQVRKYGARRWRTVTGKCRTDKGAMERAVASMQKNDKRARVLWIVRDGWYDPNVVMECAR